MDRLIAALAPFFFIFSLGCDPNSQKQEKFEMNQAAEEIKVRKFLISKGTNAKEKKAIEILLNKKAHLGWVDPKMREQAGDPYWTVHLSSVSQVTDAELEHFKQIKGLKSIGIIGSPHLTDQGMAKLAEFDQLEELTLDSHLISDLGIEKIADLKRLKKLILSGTYGRKITAQAFKGFGKLQNLQYLSLGGNFEFPAIPITDEAIVNLKGLNSLEELYLGGTKITDEALRALKTLKCLKILDLSHTAIGNEGLKLLSQSKTVEKLGLDNTQIDDGGLQYIPNFPRLKSLSITKTIITDQGLKHLGKSKLEELSLVLYSNNNQLTDQGLSFLQSISTLKHLDFIFQYTQATEKGIQNLRKALPDLYIRAYPPKV